MYVISLAFIPYKAKDKYHLSPGAEFNYKYCPEASKASIAIQTMEVLKGLVVIRLNSPDSLNVSTGLSTVKTTNRVGQKGRN